MDERGTLDLVPRLKGQGYSREEVEQRRSWVEQRLQVRLPHVASCSIPGEEMRGNIENPIGSAQVPLGIAGPLLIDGMHARGVFYVPLATTEGALVRSYERGMATLTRAGGVTTRIWSDENVVSPVFLFEDVGGAHDFARELPGWLDGIRAEAEATTRHGRLLRVDCQPAGRSVIVSFHYFTGDAQGMNMIVNATERACRWIMQRCRARRFLVFSGLCSEKRASGALFAGAKGKTVTAGALLPAAVVGSYLRQTPGEMLEVWHHSVRGHLHANATGFNAHYANGLTAMFIACGQDVANVVNASVGVTSFEPDGGDLYASVTLPSLEVATVGGGTGLGTSSECLALLGCAGAGKAPKLAEIMAATLLAGELSMAAAIGSGEFAAAHEKYGRKRPS